MLNDFRGIGRVGRPPDVKTTKTGKMMARLSIATERAWWDAEARKRRTRTEWVPLVVWGGLCKVIRDYVKKGTLIYVRAFFQTSSWEDRKTGQRRYRSEFNVEELLLLDRGTGPGTTGTNRSGSGEAPGGFDADTDADGSSGGAGFDAGDSFGSGDEFGSEDSGWGGDDEEPPF